MAKTATYVYCLIAADRRPVLPRGISGLPGIGALRLIEVDRCVWLAVADAPLPRYSGPNIDKKLSDLDWVSRAAVSHDAIVNGFARNRAVLPMKLFTIFSSDDRAVAQVRSDRRRVDRLVARVANHSEWGVRVTLARPEARPPRAGRPTRSKPPGERAATGARYLAGKKAERDASLERTGRAGRTIRELYARLSSQSKESRRRSASELPAGGGPLLLDGAFLVPRTRSPRFRSFVDREARRLRRIGYDVALTGPWPPYSFVKD